jgi:pimeloyl-ACP methyl ester carboxylesterase
MQDNFSFHPPSSIWLADGFQHRIQGRHGRRLHYITGGQGEPLLLAAGWPQSVYAWRKVISALAEHYTVVAVDLPGFGDSDKPETGYDTRAVASRLHELVMFLGWRRFCFVGHDIGCWVGYPYAASYPDRLRKLVLIDALVPGLAPSEAYGLAPERIARNWHFFFNALPDLPEALISGRERIWLTWLFNAKTTDPTAIESAALDEYVRCYSAPGGLRGGFGYYRALFESAAQNREFARERLQASVLAIGGDAGVGEFLGQMMRTVCDDVTSLIIPGCGHYIPEEAPEFLIRELLALPQAESAA